MQKDERFVVRTCGCHRGLDMSITTSVTGRPGAVRVIEKIGELDRRSKVEMREFLEGGKGDNNGTSWAHGAAQPLNGCRHWGAVFPLTDEV